MKSKYLLFVIVSMLICLVFLWRNGGKQDTNTEIVQAIPPIQVSKSIPNSSEPVLEKNQFKQHFSIEELKKSSWWTTVQREIRHREYHIKNAPAGKAGEELYSAPNHSQNFRTTFTSEGLQIGNRIQSELKWRAEIFLDSYGRGEYLESLPIDFNPIVEENTINYIRGDIEEWYVNRPEGLEQGFTIKKSVAGDGLLELVITVAGTIRPAFFSPGKVIDFLTETNERVLRCSKLLVFDSTQKQLASHFELVDNIIKIVIDDRQAVYPITIDPLFSDPIWTAVGEQNAAYFSYSVNTAGDVNGDGFSDIIVGAPNYDTVSADEGAVFLFHGSPTGPSPFISWIGAGDQAGSYFGSSVGTAGDVNGDGFSDVIIGAYRYVNSATARGRVYIYYGSEQGLNTTSESTLINDTANNPNFGICVRTAGDVNGDGYSDVIVGANGRYGIITSPGRAYVFHGSSNGIIETPSWFGSEGSDGDGFGESVGTAGDVDGDGYSDVIVGSLYEGRARVYFGSLSGVTSTGRWLAYGGGNFGTSVGTAGDVNGDGFSDIIIGANSYTDGQSAEGAAFVYYGGNTLPVQGTTTNADWHVESNQIDARLGKAVAAAGDVNGDGYADIVVSANVADDSVGQVFVYHGSAYGLNVNNGRPIGDMTNADWSQTGAEQGDWFGFSINTAGDVNGDGLSDIIVGAYKYDSFMDEEGRAYVFTGAKAGLTGESTQHANGNADEYLGMVVAPAGDVNGDGYADVVVGAPSNRTVAGKIFVYHGTEFGLNVDPAWSAQSSRCAGFYGCDEFGFTIGTAGDVNGDGYDDIIVGTSENYNPTENFPGMALVYHGSATGLDKNGDRPDGTIENADWTAQSDQDRSMFGARVATAGDVNGDGFSDVIVGAPFYDNGEIDEGRVFVYYGSPSGVAPDPAWSAEPNQVKTGFGFPVNTAGDVNGDGFSDVIVGAIWFENGQANEGKAYVFHGSATGLSPNPDWTFESGIPYAYLGFSLGSAGDVNGDGFNDVIVGAYGENDFTGKIYVFHGGVLGLNAAANWTAIGSNPGDQFGRLVATAGDVNGDGYGDVVIGAPEKETDLAPTPNEMGEINVFYGSPTGLDQLGGRPEGSVVNADFVRTQTDNNGRWYGLSAATAGDINGDGYADLVVGSPEQVSSLGAFYLYYGNGSDFTYYQSNVDMVYLKPRQFKAADASIIARLGKSDSETAFNIAMWGRNPLGRGAIKLEWEVKPAGVPFDGLGTFFGSEWYDSGRNGAILQEQVTDLVGHTAYHWRVRVRYPAGNPLGNVAGPWMVPFPGGLDISDIRTDNSAPAGGYDISHEIPTDAGQIVQASDGSGEITISFRTRDLGSNLCTLHSFEYRSIEGGVAWTSPGDDSESLSSGWMDNDGNGYASQTDFSGPIHTFTFTTKHPDVDAAIRSQDLHDVQIRFRINDGQLDSFQPTVSENFTVDNAYPTCTIDIQGDQYTNDNTPTINIVGAPGDTTHMRFAIKGETVFEDYAWEPYAATYQSLDIGPENGSKTVMIQLRDAFGNVQPASIEYPDDDIILDTEPPLEGSLIIDDSEGFINTGAILLTVGVFDQLCPNTGIDMEFAVNGSRQGVWHDFETPYAFDFCQGGCPPEGEVVVEVRFRDAAGNESDISAADVTIYDVTLNPIFFNIESDYCPASVCHIANDSPILISEVEGADFMQFAMSSSGLDTAPLLPYANVYYTEGLLPGEGNDGTVTIHARYNDMAGNQQDTSVDVVLDTQPPGALITETDQYASGSNIEVAYNQDSGETDPSGVASITMYYKRAWNTFWQEASLAGVNSPLNFTDLSGDGYYYFWLSSEDHVGNSDGNPPTLDSPDPPLPAGVYRVLYETLSPSSNVELITYDEGNTRFDIDYNYDDPGETLASGVAQVELYVKEPGQAVFPLTPYATDADGLIDGMFTYDLTGKDAGIYLFFTIATDNAGNVEDIPGTGYDRQAIFSDEFSGYAILAVGSISGSEGIEAHTLTANTVYKHLINRNFALVDDNPEQDPFDHIKYFNPYFEPQTGEDDYSSSGTVSYWTALKNAITGWALDKQKIRSGPLYIILIDHGTSDGSSDKFYLTGTEYITPDDLHEWIGDLEENLDGEGIYEDIVVVLGFCFAGSFIDELAQEPILNPMDSEEALRRIIVASTAYDEPSYRGPLEPGGVRDGEFFISTLFGQWAQDRWDPDRLDENNQPDPGYVPVDLKRAYEKAVALTEIHTDSGLVNAPAPYYDTAKQHPHMDDNGINDGNDPDNHGSHVLLPGGDGEVAEEIGFGFTTDLLDLVELTEFGKIPDVPLLSTETDVLLWAKVVTYDPDDVVWAEVRDPGTTLAGGTTQQTVDLTEVPMTWNGVDTYEATYTGFNDPGRYTVFFYAKDAEGVVSAFEKTYVYKQAEGTNQPPTTPVLQQPLNTYVPGVNASAGISFGWTAVTDPDGDAVTYTIEIQQITGCTDNCFYYQEEGLRKAAKVIDPDTPFVDLVSYSWQVTAVDRYGNESPSATWNFATDNENYTPGWIDGYIIDAVTKLPIADAAISATLAVSLPGDGYYLGFGAPTSYNFDVSATGYESKTYVITIPEGGVLNRDLELTPLAQQVATPTFNPQPGTFNLPQNIAINCTTPGAAIYYTTDGTDPTQSATLYSAAIPVSATTTIKARGYYSTYAPSAIATGTYTIDVDQGDVNWDGNVTISDAVLALQVMMGADPSSVYDDADVDGDDQIGLTEVVYILQAVAGLRD